MSGTCRNFWQALTNFAEFDPLGEDRGREANRGLPVRRASRGMNRPRAWSLAGGKGNCHATVS